jgi:hypothetical protein
MEKKDSFEIDPTYTLQREHSSDDFLRLTSSRDTEQYEKLLTAAEKGDYATVQAILSDGRAYNDHRGFGGANALHYASHRGHAAIVSCLLKAGFNVNARNDSGESPLHVAVYNGHLLIVEQLLDKGADINAVNNYNETPLIYACQKSMPALVRLLLLRGADVSIEDRYGDKAIDHASDARTAVMFDNITTVEPPGTLLYDQVLQVFSFLTAKDIGRCSMVCGKWHRASENEEVWNRLGVRRWEYALQSSLGFGPPATASFRPKTSSKKRSTTSGKK